MLRRLTPTSLTGRLIAILVAVVVVTSLLVAGVTSLAVRGLLFGQLDQNVARALDRSADRYQNGFRAPSGGLPPTAPGRRDGDGDGPGSRLGIGDAVGTLNAQFQSSDANGFMVTSSAGRRQLSTAALNRLATVPTDGQIHVVDLPGVGRFHVKATKATSGTIGPARLVSGVSTRDQDAAVGTLVLWEVLVTLAAVALAALSGRWLVRRQLRPLREVAATAHELTTYPLGSGAIGTTVRVPEQLTDERTEVGAVGAALNTMIEHVESALDERHRSEQQVRQFVADASHELRTPLTTIHGYAELSRRGRTPDAEQLAHAMGKVESEATRMSSLVEDLLLLARLDAGRPLARDEVDLTKLVLETVDDARVVGPGHRWLLDLPDDEPTLVSGDEQRLHQVVTNLLNNARRHTPEGTTVTVGVRLATGGSPNGSPDASPDASADGGAGVAVLHVSDDGPGMGPELVGRAFERFTRGDSSRTRESGGAGLGLSLVSAIAHAHGGTVSVASEPGRTRFEVRLPVLVDALSTAHRL